MTRCWHSIGRRTGCSLVRKSMTRNSEQKIRISSAQRHCAKSDIQTRQLGRGTLRLKDTKLVLSQAILWAAAILVVAMVEDQGDAVPLLAVLATMAIGLVSSQGERESVGSGLPSNGSHCSQSRRTQPSCCHCRCLKLTAFGHGYGTPLRSNQTGSLDLSG